MAAVEVCPGVAIAYERSGSGPPLVLVHGITESRRSWDPLVPLLAEQLRRRGGRPARPRGVHEGRTLRLSHARRRHHGAGRRGCGLDRPHLIGHSLGGVVVSAMAAAVDPTGVINVDQPLELSGFHAGLAPAAPLIRGTTEEFDGFIDGLFATLYGPLPAAEQDRLRALGRPDQEVVNGIWKVVIDGPVAELDALADAVLAGVTAPYLSLHGTDPGPDYAAWLTARCPTATVEVWPDHGHYPHLLDPERFLARVTEFAARA